MIAVGRWDAPNHIAHDLDGPLMSDAQETDFHLLAHLQILLDDQSNAGLGDVEQGQGQVWADTKRSFAAGDLRAPLWRPPFGQPAVSHRWFRWVHNMPPQETIDQPWAWGKPQRHHCPGTAEPSSGGQEYCHARWAS